MKHLKSYKLFENLNIKKLTEEEVTKILQENCYRASTIFNWENEEKRLIEYWKDIFKQHG